MFSKRFIRKVEKTTVKRLNKYYRDHMYVIVENVKYDYDTEDCDGYEITIRAGYSFEDSEGVTHSNQVRFTFYGYETITKKVNEIATLFTIKIVDYLDDYDHFEKRD